MRRRRLDIEDRTVHGYVDERLAGGPAEIHLTEAIVADITRQRVGEMRQIISTITPEQYELIARRLPGALVVQGGPGTGKTAVGLHRAAWLLYADPALARAGVLVVGPNRTFIAYIAQVLPALGEQSVEQRPIDALVSVRPRSAPEPEAQAALLGSARMATLLARLLWSRVGPPAAAEEIPVGRRPVVVAPGEVAAILAEARERFRAYDAGRARFRDRLADRLATRALEAARASALVSPAEVGRGGARHAGVPAPRHPLLAAADPGGARGVAVQEPPAPRRRWRTACSSGCGDRRADRPRAARAVRAPCRRACSRCSTRRAG